MQTITQITLTPGEFRAIIRDAIQDALDEYKNPDSGNDWPKYSGRQYLAKRFGVSPQTITAWDKKGLLHGEKYGRIIRYSREDVLQAIEKMKKK